MCAAGDSATCPLDPGALDLDGNRAYSVFAVGSLTGETLTAVVGVDAVGVPSTDTLGAGTDAATAGWSLPLLLVLAAGALSFALVLVTARTRR